jgi:hypothetical protein
MEIELQNFSNFGFRRQHFVPRILRDNDNWFNKKTYLAIEKNVNTKFFINFLKRWSKNWVDFRIFHIVTLEILREIKKVYKTYLIEDYGGKENSEYFAEIIENIVSPNYLNMFLDDEIERLEILVDENFHINGEFLSIYRYSENVAKWLVERCDKGEFDDNIKLIMGIDNSTAYIKEFCLMKKIVLLFPHKFSEEIVNGIRD